MHVYRVCRKEDFRIGAYNSKYGIYNCDGFDHNEARHPLPTDDSRLCANSDNQDIQMFDTTSYYCFNSIAQLRAWFYDDCWLEWLYANEYSVVEFMLDSEFVVQGNSQCIMVLHKAEEVRKLEIMEVAG